MDCKKVKSLFSDYLDDELSEVNRESFEQHLLACKNCDAEFNSLLDSWEILEDYGVPELSDNFTRKLMDKIHQQKDEITSESIFSRIRSIFSFSNFATVPAFASLLILAGIGFALLTRGPSGIIDQNPISNSEKIVVVRNLKDAEIIRDLEIYENAEMLENLDLLVDLETVENLEMEN